MAQVPALRPGEPQSAQELIGWVLRDQGELSDYVISTCVRVGMHCITWIAMTLKFCTSAEFEPLNKQWHCLGLVPGKTELDPLRLGDALLYLPARDVQREAEHAVSRQTSACP